MMHLGNRRIARMGIAPGAIIEFSEF
jgi:hypothetical protein